MKIILKQPYSFCQLGKRDNQEDARFPDEDAPQDCISAFVVCDGVGGMDKGEVASRTVADAIGKFMSKIDLSLPFDADAFKDLLAYAYTALNKQMKSDDSRDMATTMTFVCFHSQGVFCAHMGDSRIYHIRPGVGILYQSEDHSLVNEMVHSGNLTPEEAINHPKSNIITRCMGYVEPGSLLPTATTLQIDDVESGDYFFLCTDGVLHELDDAELFSIVSSDKTDKEKINCIAAKCRNSSDNNTAYLIGVRTVEANNLSADVDIQEAETQSSDDATTALVEEECNKAEEVAPSETTIMQKICKFLTNLFH